MRSVARRVGIAAPSIYPHFANPQKILLAVVEEEFDRLREQLRIAVEEAGQDVVDRLLAMCTAYLDHARTHPMRYLILFGGIWNAAPAVAEATIAGPDVAALGLSVLEDLIDRLQACVDESRSTSTDPRTDAVALWVGLHGLAHQRIVSPAFPWTPGIDDHLIKHLAQL